MNAEHNECPACEGRGGELEHDSDGDGVWAMPVTRFIECFDCLESNRCPGCMAAIEAMPADIEEWTCPLCAWHIDWGRLGPGDVDWGY